MKPLATWAAALTLLASAGSAQAALTDLGNGTVLNSTDNLIWVQDWSVSGANNWATQIAWAQNLNFAGSSDWRLASSADVSNLAHYLFVIPEFRNVQHLTWLADEVVVGQTARAVFYNSFGGHFPLGQQETLFGVAVRSANATAVPEPQSLALVLLALGGAAVATRRRAL